MKELANLDPKQREITTPSQQSSSQKQGSTIKITIAKALQQSTTWRKPKIQISKVHV
jgi:hypothetical protein